MSDTSAIAINRKHSCTATVFACVFVGALISANSAASAQENQSPRVPASRTENHSNVFAEIGRWFDQQFSKFNSNMQGARLQFDNFGHEADAAAKDAAGTLARLPKARVIRIHEECALAPNGAPDCESVALKVCKARGYVSGKSVDMTTAEKCPARVWVSGRPPAPGECTTETFVSSVLCN